MGWSSNRTATVKSALSSMSNYIENILDEAIFLKNGEISIFDNCDRIREQSGKSLDGVFREVFRCSAN